MTSASGGVGMFDERNATAPGHGPGAVRTGRPVVIHYHLFKNAGTSVDAILRRNFGNRWIEREFPAPPRCDHQRAVREIIAGSPDLAALSSHTLLFPVPAIEGVEVFPIVFVRHPLDRLRSAYEFERKQNADTRGAILAKEVDFAGYLTARLATQGDRSCCDFQCARLSLAFPGAGPTERERALAAIDRLPFVGLVEAFADSVQRLGAQVRNLFPDFVTFQVRMNTARRAETPLDQRLAEIKDELGAELYDRLVAVNQADLDLFRKVAARYGVEWH